GLPEAIACPQTIPATPTFTHNYVSNNFEFDNNGDIWSFSAYNPATGQCNLDKFDVATGNVINTRVLQFPAGNFPNAITSGDLCILPNGRLFATLGDSPSRLYEIENYTAPGQTVQVKFLRALPKPCYGIAYLNGLLELTGTNLSNSCYYYTYDFANDVLGNEKPFQNGQGPIDNTSITPTIGTTKRLLNASLVNPNTADLTYEVHVRNMGNTILNDVNVTENLAEVFGAQHISNVSVSFAPGGNVAGLTLNPNYNGTTLTQLLMPGQSLPNQTGNDQNYFVTIRISLRVTNLTTQQVYRNSAIASAAINNEAGRIFITDSSNNGMPSAIDPNNNGNPTELGENVPTPFDFAILPVKFLGFEARLLQPMQSEIRWRIAVPAAGADHFEVQWSPNAVHWQPAGRVDITDPLRSSYALLHAHQGPPEMFYRIRQVDKDGAFVYTQVIRLQQTRRGQVSIAPNPVKDVLNIVLEQNATGRSMATIYDQAGRALMQQPFSGSNTRLRVGHLPAGTYRILISGDHFTASRSFTIIR
ncbi:MAG TPA: T9SS type A sorting domain-containing protein, partial [Phnomibacter sp.]|nr:T9SS type A sorting domain-containing protein [Phnomibacter sp.]